MKAARFIGDRKIIIDEEARPVPAPGEVLLKVELCGLCGSDKKPFEAGFPLIPGHEVSGTVVDANGTNVPVGTRAVAYLSVYCGQCNYCMQGLTNNCVNRKGLLGWSEPWNGGYAEYMAVPSKNILPLDESVSFEAGVLLLDTFGTAWHALRIADVGPETSVLIVGCGPLGLGAVAGAVAFGAAKVYACDLFDYRLQAAKDLGGIPCTPVELGTIDQVDVIVEAAGTQPTLMSAIRQIAPLGKVVMLGENWKRWEFEPDADTMLKDYSVIRSWYFPHPEFYLNQQFVIDKRVDVDKLISHTMKLDDLQEAFDLFFSGETRKVLAAS